MLSGEQREALKSKVQELKTEKEKMEKPEGEGEDEQKAEGEEGAAEVDKEKVEQLTKVGD